MSMIPDHGMVLHGAYKTGPSTSRCISSMQRFVCDCNHLRALLHKKPYRKNPMP